MLLATSCLDLLCIEFSEVLIFGKERKRLCLIYLIYCYKCQISQSHGSSLFKYADLVMICWSSDWASEWGGKVIKVTLNVSCLLVPHWVFSTQSRFTKNGLKNKEHHVSRRTLGNAVLMPEDRRMTSLFGADRKVTLDRTSLLSANNRTLRLTLTKAGQQKIKQRFPGLSLCFGIKVAASEFGLSSMKGSCFGCGVTVTAILFDTYQKALKTTAYRPFVTTV